METSNTETGAAFGEKLALLGPEDRAGVHDRINALLAERRRPPEKPAPEGGGVQGATGLRHTN